MMEPMTGRTAQLLDTAAERSRVTVRQRLARLWTVLPAVLQTAIAAAVAFSLARDVVGHPGPFVAAVSAIVALGITYGQRTRRAVEIVLGVAVGVFVSDLLTITLGTGPGQIALVIGLAMSAAIVLGGSRLVVSQSATSAALVATVAAPGHLSFDRPVDALIGGGVALLVNLVISPVNPARLARRAATPVLEELAAVLRDVAAALEARDHDGAVDALARARGLDPLMARFAEAAEVGVEVAALSPLRRSHRADLELYRREAEQIDLAVRNVRVLARGAVRAVDLEAHVPPETVVALRELASGAVALAPDPVDPERAARARVHVLDAAGRATLGLERTGNLSASVIVGQVRSMATDLLKGLGATDAEAVDDVRRAARGLSDAELAQED
ncbi:MAG: aromatic acid exporter family protein [Solirubrobacterales bacterium]|nr:aromatic acid exporter family protein [Solirubrobacterales bacterium]